MRFVIETNFHFFMMFFHVLEFIDFAKASFHVSSYVLTLTVNLVLRFGIRALFIYCLNTNNLMYLFTRGIYANFNQLRLPCSVNLRHVQFTSVLIISNLSKLNPQN